MCEAAIDDYPVERPGEIDPEAIQSLALAVLLSAWRDSGSHHRLDSLGAVAFVYSPGLQFWADLAGLSYETRARFKRAVEDRAADGSRKRRAYARGRAA